MLTHKSMFLKFVGVTPSQLVKLHEFCNSSTSRLPFVIPTEHGEDFYSKDGEGTRCVFVKDAKFDATAETYTVSVKVYTEFYVQSYSSLDGEKLPRLPKVKDDQCEEPEGYLLTPPHSLLDILFQALELFWHSPVMEVKDFRAQRLT